MSARARLVALVTGASGQVGRELIGTAPDRWQVIACDSTALDITHPEAVADVFGRHRPDLVIHTAAYTDVEAAERESERAEAVNATGTAHVATAAHRAGARLIYLSTDFVFDGGQGRPYTVEDRPRPLGVYGRTKRAGEREALRICGAAGVVFRTAWVYSTYRRNFVLTMLRLMRERDQLGVVADQVGTPTWARSLARALWMAADRPQLAGIHHWTDAGVASWYDFAVAISEEALALGLVSAAIPLHPLRTDERPSVAPRPSYSVLDVTRTAAALELPRQHWRANLRLMLRELRDA